MRPKNRRIVKTIIFLLFILTTCSQAKITKGPFLLRVEQNRAALMWESDIEGPGKLSYGINQVSKNNIVTVPERIKYEVVGQDGLSTQKTVFIHKTWVENLKEDCVYFYRVADPNHSAKTYNFHTQSPDANQITFAVYGDSRTYPENHQKIIEQIRKHNVDFVVNSGDVVTRGEIYPLWSKEFFEPLKGLAEFVPVYTIKGNHDISQQGYFEKLLVPPGQTANYSFDYGPLHYYCADNYSGTEPEVLDMIVADMNNTTSPWKFVSYHIPSLNFGGHWSSWGYPDALSAFSKANIDFVITGHSHQFEWFHPIAPASDTNEHYVTYITSGGGGARLYDIEPTYYHVNAKGVHHFCLFRIDASKIERKVIQVDNLLMRFINIKGKHIGHTDWLKANGKLGRQFTMYSLPLELVQFHQNLYHTCPMTLPKKPQKNQPFKLIYKLSVPPLDRQIEIKFNLRAEPGHYKLPEPKTVVIPKQGGDIDIEFTVTALIEVELSADKYGRPKPITPYLVADCSYKLGKKQELISKRVHAKQPENPR